MKQESVDTLLRRCGPNQGVSIAHYLPYWDVVVRRNEAGKLEYIVTDSSTLKPHRVYGPTTQADADQWAMTTALLFMTVKGSLI